MSIIIVGVGPAEFDGRSSCKFNMRKVSLVCFGGISSAFLFILLSHGGVGRRRSKNLIQREIRWEGHCSGRDGHNFLSHPFALSCHCSKVLCVKFLTVIKCLRLQMSSPAYPLWSVVITAFGFWPCWWIWWILNVMLILRMMAKLTQWMTTGHICLPCFLKCI